MQRKLFFVLENQGWIDNNMDVDVTKTFIESTNC